MKTETKKYIVIKSLTRDQIQSIGISRWLREHKYILIAWGASIVAQGVLISIFKYRSTGYWIMFGFLIGYFIVTFYAFWIKLPDIGKKFFDSVKNLQDPIDLREPEKEVKYVRED